MPRAEITGLEESVPCRFSGRGISEIFPNDKHEMYFSR